ncbi:MAG: YdcF family protein [Terracidiphilus sp.]
MTGTRTSSRNAPRRKTGRAHGTRQSGSPRSNRLVGGRTGWLGWLVLTSCVVILGLFGWAVLSRQFAPTSNTSLTRFDAIIVLGAPADTDGNPSPTQLARVTEAVHEYERGVAPRLIVSGGADGSRPVEAMVMARTAEAQGIPASAIYQEGKARDTIENGCYSVRIMESHGWHTAEVVSSASHLPRAGIIFSGLPLEWRAHAAPPLEPVSTRHSIRVAALETLKTLRYLVWTRQMEPCEP